MTTKPEPLTEAEVQELRDFLASDIAGEPPVPKCIDEGRPLSRLLATLDATRAQLARSEAQARTDRAFADDMRSLCKDAQSQLTAATQRADNAERAYSGERIHAEEMQKKRDAANAALDEAKRQYGLGIEVLETALAESNARAERAEAERDEALEDLRIVGDHIANLHNESTGYQFERDAARREVERMREALESAANELCRRGTPASVLDPIRAALSTSSEDGGENG